MQDTSAAAPRSVYDIVIAGGGIAGLSLAAALKQALGRGAQILIVDPAMGEREGRDRASAIAPGSRRLFMRIGAWDQIAPLAQPIRRMIVADGRVRDAVRPPHLHFDEFDDDEPLAHMAMNDDVVAGLVGCCRQFGVDCLKGTIGGFELGRHTIEATIQAGAPARARLLIGADGARSPLRARAAIATVGWDYGQSAIVATIAHEREHEGRAEQHFLPGGPFAILPLPGRRSSIVWSEPRAAAERLIALAPEEFKRELEYRFTLQLGEIEPGRPRAFPLGLRIARRFVAERLALVGDAAHLVHPLAGQGLNLGLRDVAALAEILVARMRLGLDPGAPDVLAEFERARRFDVAASGLGMDVMNRLFSNDVAPLRALRDFGLRLVDRAPSLKRVLIEEAAGARGAAPRLLRGLAI